MAIEAQNGIYHQQASNSISLLFLRQLIGLAKQTDLPEIVIESWWKARREQDKPTTLLRFYENFWRFCYHSLSFVFGLAVLWNKSWLWNVIHVWIGYPHQVSLCKGEGIRLSLSPSNSSSCSFSLSLSIQSNSTAIQLNSN